MSDTDACAVTMSDQLRLLSCSSMPLAKPTRMLLVSASERIALLEGVLAAARKLRVMTAEEMENGKPFWVVPCDSYEPLEAAIRRCDATTGEGGCQK